MTAVPPSRPSPNSSEPYNPVFGGNHPQTGDDSQLGEIPSRFAPGGSHPQETSEWEETSDWSAAAQSETTSGTPTVTSVPTDGFDFGGFSDPDFNTITINPEAIRAQAQSGTAFRSQSINITVSHSPDSYQSTVSSGTPPYSSPGYQSVRTSPVSTSGNPRQDIDPEYGFPPSESTSSNRLFTIIPVAVVISILVVGFIIWVLTTGDLSSESASDPVATARTPATPNPAPTYTPTSTPSPTPTPEETADQPGSSAGSVKFGETYTWSNGYAISVSIPEIYTPGRLAQEMLDNQPVIFTMTILNGTGEELDVAHVSLDMVSAGERADRLWDPENDVPLIPHPDTLAEGAEFSWNEAFDVLDPSDLTLTIKSFNNFGSEDAVFTL